MGIQEIDVDRIIRELTINNYPKGTTGVIVEIFENTDAYLEIVDDAGNTIDVIYDVPLSILKKKK